MDKLVDGITAKRGRIVGFLPGLLFFFASIIFPLAPSWSADESWVFNLNPKFEKDYSYSIGVRAGDYLFIGGVTAVDEEGNEVYANDMKKQMELIYQRVGKVLAAHGASFRHVVRETILTTDMERYVSEAQEVRSRYYQGVAGPTASGAEVSRFTSDNILVEITLIAYVGE